MHADLFVAPHAANVDAGGSPVFIPEGAVVRQGNPVLAAHPDLFTPLVLSLSYEPDLAEAEVTVTVTGGAHDPENGAPLRTRVRRGRTETVVPFIA